MRRIETADDLARGAAELARIDPRLAPALALCAPLPLRRKPDGFATLLEAIVGQQVSTASAAAICGRLRAAGLDAAAPIRAATDEDLRACGLSRPKMRYVRSLAEADPDWAALRHAPAEDVTRILTALPGIGPWTAETYAMFALGHEDVFAPGDLALQEGARLLLDLPARPGAREMRAIAEGWSPWRAVAARLLWAYYARAKGREGTL
ncbi:DNA-3-methyladenine glycosylase family protein [Jannaschia formosa]|uniref:DNA-3-methyladenine glycosylase family protein n=1 Tax=Jannaschia formosa TaxID=2259592 RepID=UPI000E1BF9A6|nr:DNA-3-methyladenine glycosylase [Jannaschia formosa]TFL18269.1 DNA-3-methyladenine glycosylase 2 family protein [Jannaschia formosa]